MRKKIPSCSNSAFHTVKSTVKISSIFVVFLENMNFTSSVSVAIGVIDSLLNSEPLKLLIFNSCSENLEDLCLVFRFFFFRIFDGWSMILFLSSNTSSSVCWPNEILYLGLRSLVSHSEICYYVEILQNICFESFMN